VYVLAAAAALHAFWFPNTDSAMQAYSYALIPDRLLGRAMAASNTLRAAAAPFGPLLAGLLLARPAPRVCLRAASTPDSCASALRLDLARGRGEYCVDDRRELGLVAERRLREIRVRVDRAGRRRGERLVERFSGHVRLHDLREGCCVLEEEVAAVHGDRRRR